MQQNFVTKPPKHKSKVGASNMKIKRYPIWKLRVDRCLQLFALEQGVERIATQWEHYGTDERGWWENLPNACIQKSQINIY